MLQCVEERTDGVMMGCAKVRGWLAGSWLAVDWSMLKETAHGDHNCPVSSYHVGVKRTFNIGTSEENVHAGLSTLYVAILGVH